jgi:hypothetical protein
VTQRRAKPASIEAMLEDSGDELRLWMHIDDGACLEERGVTVRDAAEAARELASFAARYPGAPVERRGSGWRVVAQPVRRQPACRSRAAHTL